MDISSIVSIVGAVISILGAVVMISKAKPEKKKLEAEGSASIADAAESVATGAKVSNELLLTRIKELEEREEKRERMMKARELAWDAEMRTLKEQVQELERYKDWALRLAQQVRNKGEEPVPFLIPAPNVGRD